MEMNALFESLLDAGTHRDTRSVRCTELHRIMESDNLCAYMMQTSSTHRKDLISK
jgi:hypothetical protein